jgi:hypothetical protein
MGAISAQVEQQERVLDLAVSLIAAPDANLRHIAAHIVCARVEMACYSSDAVVRAIELGLRSARNDSVKLFIVHFLSERLGQEPWTEPILAAVSLYHFIAAEMCPLSASELSMSCQLSSYAEMKMLHLARDEFLSSALQLAVQSPQLSEAMDDIRMILIHQMASEDGAAIIEEVGSGSPHRRFSDLTSNKMQPCRILRRQV